MCGGDQPDARKTKGARTGSELLFETIERVLKYVNWTRSSIEDQRDVGVPLWAGLITLVPDRLEQLLSRGWNVGDYGHAPFPLNPLPAALIARNARDLNCQRSRGAVRREVDSALSTLHPPGGL